MLLFAAMSFLYTLAPNPYFLLPVRILTGLAMTSTFFIGVAYLGDLVAERQQGVVIGLYHLYGFGVRPWPRYRGSDCGCRRISNELSCCCRFCTGGFFRRALGSR